MNYQHELRALRERRDMEIRRLRQENPSLTARAIASRVCCSVSTVYEALKPERREAYNQRRRKHWHLYAAQRRAA